MGRPSLPVRDRRATFVRFRLRDDERVALERAAKREGLRLSAWVRRVLAAAAGA